MQQEENDLSMSRSTEERAEESFRETVQLNYQRTDKMFAVLMVIQWLAGVVAAYWISPLTWAGSDSKTHPHVWAAIFLGGLITSLPVMLAVVRPGWAPTRYMIAVGQMLMGALVIHLSGGRIEAHFHIFGSLAFLAIYRDWRVLIPATVIVAADHILRGIYYPQSIYGVLTGGEWRWVEHAFWVIFEDIFLVISCQRAWQDMWSAARRGAELFSREARYRSVIEQTTDGICLFDFQQNKVIESNEAFRKLLGYTSAELADASSGDILRKGSHEWVDLSPAITDKRSMTIEKRYNRPDNSFVDVSVTINPVSYDGNDVLCFVAHDITMRKAAEEALKKHNDDLAERVAERTVALASTKGKLEAEIAERKKAMEDLTRYQKFFQNAKSSLQDGLDLAESRV
jgi:PAS domain S-box-containing protein